MQCIQFMNDLGILRLKKPAEPLHDTQPTRRASPHLLHLEDLLDGLLFVQSDPHSLHTTSQQPLFHNCIVH
jgi:hypothetical protein